MKPKIVIFKKDVYDMTLAIKVDLNIKLENEDVKTQVGRVKSEQKPKYVRQYTFATFLN